MATDGDPYQAEGASMDPSCVGNSGIGVVDYSGATYDAAALALYPMSLLPTPYAPTDNGSTGGVSSTISIAAPGASQTLDLTNPEGPMSWAAPEASLSLRAVSESPFLGIGAAALAQVIDDLPNPGLTAEQRAARATAAGGLALIAALPVALIAVGVIAPFTPAIVAAGVISIGASWALDETVKPWLFEGRAFGGTP